MDTAKGRLWEIDTLRGIAICMMIIYHIFFDLTFFNVYPLPLDTLIFKLFLYPIGTLFLLIVGISLVLGDQKNTQKQSAISPYQRFRSQSIRGLSIFGVGMIITLVTYIYPHEGFIRFGVLHCIGISIILSFFYLRHRILSAVTGIIIIIIGVLIQQLTINTTILFWLGLKPPLFYTLDYFPLLPWFGVVLIGISLGNLLYKNYSRNYHLKDLSNKKTVTILSFLGRHSLLIYVFHQPIIILLLYPFMS
jgi:uncharacterized membrane protein